MKDEPMVSVIITTFGRSWDKICPTVESVKRQTYGNLECIIVDDNGMESVFSKEIEEKLKCMDMPALYLRNRENSGAQYSRNRGILESKGTFVAFLDDDDIWKEDKLEKQIPLFCDQQVGLVYCKGWTVYASEKRKCPYNMSECFLNRLDFQDLSYGDYIGTTSQAVIRREIFSKAGLFDIDQPARQDYEMWIRISQYCVCAGAETYLFEHVQHEGKQISKSLHNAAVGMERIYKKHSEKFSWTARWHCSFLTFKAWKKCGVLGKCLIYGGVTIGNFVMAAVCDRKELEKRIAIHKTRK